MFRSKSAAAILSGPSVPTRLAQQCGRAPPVIDPVPVVPLSQSTPPPSKHLHPFTPETLLDALKCPKKYLLHNSLTADEQPPLSSTDIGLLEDGLSFRHLSQTLVSMKNPQSTYRITSAAYGNAVEETAEFLRWYFTDYLPTKDPLHEKPLSLQSAALICATQFGGEVAELHTRVGLLTYLPSKGEWGVIGSRASSKLSSADKSERFIKHMFQLYCLQQCVTPLSTSVCHTSFAEKLKGAAPFHNSIQSQKLLAANCPVHFLQPRRVHLSVDSFTTRTLNTLIGTLDGGEIQLGFDLYYLDSMDGSVRKGAKPSVAPITEDLTNHLRASGINRSSLDIDKFSSIVEFALSQMSTVLSKESALLAAFKLDGDRKPSALTALSQTLKEQGHTAEKLTKSELKGRLAAIPHYSLFGENCSKCEYFVEGYCRAASAVDAVGHEAVFHMPSMTSRVKRELFNRGSTTPSNILDEAASGFVKLSEKQRLFVEAASQQEVFVHPEQVGKWLKSIEYPLIAIDFESSSFALPPFENLLPYQAVPFQYSAAVLYGDVTDPAFSLSADFHAVCAIGEDFDPKTDPRVYLGAQLSQLIGSARDKFKQLHPSISTARKSLKPEDALSSHQSRISKDVSKKMIVTAGRGSVLAHNVSFEKQCFKTIAQHPKGKHLAPLFDSLVFIDSLKAASEGIVHPLSLGSNSLKKLVPALLPHLPQYTGLAIKDGGAASSVYRNWYMDFTRKLPQEFGKPADQANSYGASDYAQYNQKRKEYVEKYASMRKDLISYCNMDTVQMVEVVREIARLSTLAQTSSKARTHRDGWIALPFSEVDRTRPNTFPLQLKL